MLYGDVDTGNVCRTNPNHPECKKCDSPNAIAYFQKLATENEKPQDSFVLEGEIYDPEEHAKIVEHKFTRKERELLKREGSAQILSGESGNQFGEIVPVQVWKVAGEYMKQNPDATEQEALEYASSIVGGVDSAIIERQFKIMTQAFGKDALERTQRILARFKRKEKISGLKRENKKTIHLIEFANYDFVIWKIESDGQELYTVGWNEYRSYLEELKEAGVLQNIKDLTKSKGRVKSKITPHSDDRVDSYKDRYDPGRDRSVFEKLVDYQSYMRGILEDIVVDGKSKLPESTIRDIFNYRVTHTVCDFGNGPEECVCAEDYTDVVLQELAGLIRNDKLHNIKRCDQCNNFFWTARIKNEEHRFCCKSCRDDYYNE